ncbi:MAG: ATP synthase subunit I [Acidimicrobiales bacterium]
MTPPVEREIVADMVRRARWLLVLPVLCALVWGLDGALSSVYGAGLALGNLLLAAALMAWAAGISPGALMATALFGYLGRLALVTVAVLAVVEAAWVEVVPLGLTLIVAHLGLLAMEVRHVSGSLAYPGLKPAARP